VGYYIIILSLRSHQFCSPMKPNPTYKGKWYAPMIDNPAYVGEWAPRKIANPAFFEDLTPLKSLEKIGGIGIELWTMTEDILFDNIYVGHSVEDAKKLAEESFDVKKPIEVELAKPPKKDEPAAKPSVDFKSDPVEFVRQMVFTFIDLAKEDPITAFKTHPETGGAIVVGVLTLFGMVGALFGLIGGASPPAPKVNLSFATHYALVDLLV
jgi:hypothetical protein